MKLFLTVAFSLTMIALIAHAQSLPPGYPAPPSAYPPPAYAPPPPPPPETAPPAYIPAPGPVEMIPPPPAQPPSPQQAVNPLPPAPQQPATPALQPQQQGNIIFVSGGAGEDDRDALKQVEGQYNLRLLFAARNGDYLANVAVTLADAHGKVVLDTIADGPIFYARVPAGRYRVTVSNEGQSQSRDIDLSRSGAVRQDFYWASA